MAILFRFAGGFILTELRGHRQGLVSFFTILPIILEKSL